MLLLEPAFAEPVLLDVMMGAQADAPPIGRFERGTAIRSEPDMGAFDGQVLAARDRAVMPAHPGAVGGTGA